MKVSARVLQVMAAVLWSILTPVKVLASESADLEAQIASWSVRSVLTASLILVVLLGLSALLKKHSSKVFGVIILTVTSTSLFLIGSTIYLNVVSSSKGPVHWHADFEVWACGEKQDLQNPKGRLSNKVGTATLHEHNDERIHLEGVVVEPKDASLGKFWRVVGGELTKDALVMPTVNGVKSFVSGQDCNGQPAAVQVFVYKVADDNYYSQTKLADPAAYVISPESNIPPGDCVIVEFGQAKDRTDRLCAQYKYAEQRGELKGER
jgi:hypothetical protein